MLSSAGGPHSIHEHLSRLITSGQYGAGMKLPTERALAEQLRVPRGAVRDALAVLESEGAVIRRIGSGTFVARPGSDEQPGLCAGAALDASPAEIMAGRILLEPRIAMLAAIHATAAGLEEIEAYSRQAEGAETFEQFERWDAAFHHAIAEAAHNRLIAELFATITRARDHAEWGELKRRSVTQERRAQYEEEHRRIVRALRARDGAKAEIEVLTHLQGVRRNLLGF